MSTAKKIKVDLNGVWCPCYNVGFGTRLYVCFAPAYPQILGMVWGNGYGGKKTKFDIMGSYVLPWARRNGVRSAINRQILKDYDVLMTGGATKEGRGFMNKDGYAYIKETDMWFKIKRRRK